MTNGKSENVEKLCPLQETLIFQMWEERRNRQNLIK